MRPAPRSVRRLPLLSSTACAATAAIASAQPYYLFDQKLTPADASAGEWHGYRVAVSGDRILAGTWYDGDLGSGAGSAYVYRRVNGLWAEEAELHPGDSEPGDFIGSSVALLNDLAVFGSDGDDDLGINAGAVYVFRHDGNNWVEEAKLLASDGQPFQSFGRSVAVTTDLVIASSQFDNDNGTNSGSAYIFRYNGNAWIEEAKLTPGDAHAGQFFGFSVGISGPVAVVGAIGDNTASNGSAYVFRYDGNSWVEEQELIPADTSHSDELGTAVAAFGNLVIVTDDADDETAHNAGAAYIFRHNGNTWVEETKLLASDGGTNHAFGWRRAASISSNYALVGAVTADANQTDAGAAYVFRWTGNDWIEDAKLIAPDGKTGDNFGRSVSLQNATFVVGAPLDHTQAGGNAGSAYVFGISDTCIADFNNDGHINIDDILDFLDAFVNNSPTADIAPTFGVLDIDDVLAFLDAFATGCGF